MRIELFARSLCFICEFTTQDVNLSGEGELNGLTCAREYFRVSSLMHYQSRLQSDPRGLRSPVELNANTNMPCFKGEHLLIYDQHSRNSSAMGNH